MRFSEFLERYVYVRKCVGCGKRLGYEHRDDAFCNACRISWERAKGLGCPDCFMSMSLCRCMPKSLASAGMIDHRKLVAYMPSHANNPENKLIYFLKHNKSKRVAFFTADQLSYKIEELLSSNNETRDGVVLTFVPRSPRSYAKHGVDQARLVAESLSEMVGIQCLPLIRRRKSGKHEQKSLGLRERRKNVAGLFEIDERYMSRLSGRSVIVFDDVVTSGASMIEATRILRREKIKNIYGLSIARSVKEKS